MEITASDARLIQEEYQKEANADPSSAWDAVFKAIKIKAREGRSSAGFDVAGKKLFRFSGGLYKTLISGEETVSLEFEETQEEIVNKLESLGYRVRLWGFADGYENYPNIRYYTTYDVSW